MLRKTSSVAADVGSGARLPAETWLWTLVLLALIAWRIAPGFIPSLADNDGFQYLRMADLALSGKIGYSDLIYFDAERSFGTIPAPMVTFPPGYALVIAFLGMFGIPLELASLLISALAIAGCIPLLAWCGKKLGLPRGALSVVALLFLANFWTLNFATSVMSEALFTFMVLGATALLLSARESVARYAIWRWILCGLMFGLAYWIRYAGLFFVVALGCLAAGYVLRRNRAIARGYVMAFVAAVIPVLGGIARNLLLVGNWRGGNEKVVSHPWVAVTMDTARAFNTLLLGPGTLRNTALLRGGVLLFLGVGLGILLFQAIRVRRDKSAPVHTQIHAPTLDVAVLICVYVACMFYAGLTSVISYGYRMMFPVLPLALLFIASIANQPVSRAYSRNRLLVRMVTPICVMGIGLYAYLNLVAVSFSSVVETAQHIPRLLETVEAGKSARTAVREATGGQGAIIANCGQAIGYFLGYPTVALTNPLYSQITWSESKVHSMAARFNAKAIVIAKDISIEPDYKELMPSTFVQQLAQDVYPSWLRPTFRSNQFVVYAIRSSSG